MQKLWPLRANKKYMSMPVCDCIERCHATLSNPPLQLLVAFGTHLAPGVYGREAALKSHGRHPSARLHLKTRADAAMQGSVSTCTRLWRTDAASHWHAQRSGHRARGHEQTRPPSPARWRKQWMTGMGAHILQPNCLDSTVSLRQAQGGQCHRHMAPTCRGSRTRSKYVLSRMREISTWPRMAARWSGEVSAGASAQARAGT